MPVAAIASAAATVGSAVIGGVAANSAAHTQANAANQASAVQQQMYGQTRGDLAPFRSFGGAASNKLSDLLGLNYSAGAPSGGGGFYAPTYNSYLQANPDIAAEAQRVVGSDARFPTLESYLQWHAQNYPGENRPPTADAVAPQPVAAGGGASDSSRIQAALESLPGYQFTRDQGIASVNRVLGSLGQTGAQAKGIARFVTGLADSTYNSQVANLQNATNTGENAAAQTGTIGQAYGSNIGNNIVGAGTANAAGTVGAANAASGALGSIPSYLLINKVLGDAAGGAKSASGIYGAGYSGADLSGIPGG